MKLLADAIAADKTPFSPDLQRVRDSLRRPIANHAAQASFGQTGVERFVFSAQDYTAIDGDFHRLDMASRNAIIDAARPVLPSFWIEYQEPGWWHGFHIEVVRGQACYSYFLSRSRGRDPNFVGRVRSDLPLSGSDAFDVEWNDSIRVCETTEKWLASQFIVVLVLLAAVASPRVTSVERIEASGEGRAERERARRRAQRGLPMLSYNVVTLKRPATAVHRGDQQEATGAPSVRGHWVIGHWRLIQGELEAFWTWVEGHERGDAGLGVIVKERHFKQAAGSRNGLAIPAFAGLRGQRVVASPSSSPKMETAK